ncbi:MAG: hypothetical protein QOF77_1066 [Solirubrobacteraceae bacterium]|jgi:hypothetical protein|nr:hypothetical protein [Solirubrobacteraceae bacterium]
MHAFLRTRSRSAGRSLATAALLLGVAGAGTVFVPIAQADSVTSVRSHVHGADAALRQVVAAAGGGSVSGPLAQLRAHLSAAGKDSAKLYRSAHHAHKARVSVRAATALTKLAAQENRDTTTLTPLLGQLGGAGQTEIAGFIASATQGREQALSLVTELLGQLPAPVQAQIAGIVAQLSNIGSGQAGELAGAISPGSIACPAIDAVSTVIGTVLSSVQADLARVLAIIPFLPPEAASQLTAVLNGLPGQLNSLLDSVKQAFNCPSPTPGAGTTSPTPDPGSGLGALAGTVVSTVGSLVSSITELIQKLLSSFLPGIGAGQTPSPVAAGGSVSSLPSPMSFIPNFASFFGGAMGSGFFGAFGGFGG